MQGDGRGANVKQSLGPGLGVSMLDIHLHSPQATGQDQNAEGRSKAQRLHCSIATGQQRLGIIDPFASRHHLRKRQEDLPHPADDEHLPRQDKDADHPGGERNLSAITPQGSRGLHSRSANRNADTSEDQSQRCHVPSYGEQVVTQAVRDKHVVTLARVRDSSTDDDAHKHQSNSSHQHQHTDPHAEVNPVRGQMVQARATLRQLQSTDSHSKKYQAQHGSQINRPHCSLQRFCCSTTSRDPLGRPRRGQSSKQNEVHRCHGDDDEADHTDGWRRVQTRLLQLRLGRPWVVSGAATG
mmetsp:Transcript_19791/g.48094  ORF Transcript_19791/g.48094 Transcript_19791/m.48094 type:complete len:297 (-) Transcript_19791:331-1221(-)